MDLELFFKSFLEQEKLPKSYEQIARVHFVPLAERLVTQSNTVKRPLFVGINGSQGSGKSTLTAFLVAYLSQILDCKTIGMSIDDFYLTKAQRQQLAQSEHPLLATRGVPGTHDLSLLKQTLDALFHAQPPYRLPVFSKALDDRVAHEHWQQVFEPTKIIILEGWCVGCPSQDQTTLVNPVNTLEELEDADGRWRSFTNSALQQYEQSVFSKIDRLIMLKAPGFHVVKQWRLEQEEKLAATLQHDISLTEVMTPEQIERFIAHYQRITEHGFLHIPEIADEVFCLDNQRHITSGDFK